MTTLAPEQTADEQTGQSQEGASAKGAVPFRKIDHIALAVVDLEDAIVLFRDILGFELKQRRHINGKLSGMVSAEMEGNGMKFVLCQGTEPESQVAQLVRNFGPGVAHIALEVEDVDGTVQALKSRGMDFDTTVIRGPGLEQAFSSRCMNSGMSFEIIHREGEQGFLDSNVQSLFDQLEQSGKY